MPQQLSVSTTHRMTHDETLQQDCSRPQARLLHITKHLHVERRSPVVKIGQPASNLHAVGIAATSVRWKALQAPADGIARLLDHEPDPFRAMAEMRTPGVVVRGAYPSADIPRLVQRLIDRRLIRGPDDPVELTSDGTLSDVLRDEHGRVYKGSKYLRPEANGRGSRPGMGGWTPSRIDIGTSFGGGGWPDKDAFLTHSAGTLELFSTLFDGLADPVEALYSCCSALASKTEQRVTVAHEPDGRSYGPAIFRVHYPGHDYQPHINHVGQTKRARRLHNLAPKASEIPPYEVFRFDHQFAALICVQHTTSSLAEGHSKTISGTTTTSTPQAIVHRVRPTLETASSLSSGAFGEYLTEHNIESATLDVEPGDFYIFNAGLLHEVPIIKEGGTARIVLATFIGYSEHDREIMVWS